MIMDCMMIFEPQGCEAMSLTFVVCTTKEMHLALMDNSLHIVKCSPDRHNPYCSFKSHTALPTLRYHSGVFKI